MILLVDISSKNETTDYALMFIPSEAVFSEIQANYIHLVEYASKKKVWITSPTTLVYMLTMILVINQDLEKEKNAEKMLDEINKLYNDFRLVFICSTLGNMYFQKDRLKGYQKVLIDLMIPDEPFK